MKRVIGIDSNIFIWGIRGVSSPGQEDKIDKARRFIKWVESKEWNILLPTPLIAEIISPVPQEEQQKLLSLIDKRFIVAPFDIVAAKKCGELLYRSYTAEELKEYRRINSIPKQKMKYDCMIASICIVRKVDTIYTNDGDIARFSNGQIIVKDIPPIVLPGTQQDIFST